jgi:hypothetical protein
MLRGDDGSPVEEETDMIATDMRSPVGNQATTRQTRQSLLARHPLASYVALAFAGTWLPLLPMVLGQGEHGLGLLPIVLPDPVLLVLGLLATFGGPLPAAFIVTAATEGRPGVRRLVSRMRRWRVGAPWYLVAIVAPLLIWLTTYSLFLGSVDEIT